MLKSGSPGILHRSGEVRSAIAFVVERRIESRVVANFSNSFFRHHGHIMSDFQGRFDTGRSGPLSESSVGSLNSVYKGFPRVIFCCWTVNPSPEENESVVKRRDT